MRRHRVEAAAVAAVVVALLNSARMKVMPNSWFVDGLLRSCSD
jgi:hypothetical protein